MKRRTVLGLGACQRHDERLLRRGLERLRVFEPLGCDDFVPCEVVVQEDGSRSMRCGSWTNEGGASPGTKQDAPPGGHPDPSTCANSKSAPLTVHRPGARLPLKSTEHRELLAQREVLRREVRPFAKGGG